MVSKLGAASPERRGVAVNIDNQLYQLWGEQVTYIAQLELFMVLAGIIQQAGSLRGMQGVWFIDNTVALMALVRGRSNSASLERLAHLIHSALFALQCGVYFEWIQSESNWADGISRLGLQDEWARRHLFDLATGELIAQLLTLPQLAMIYFVRFL